MINQSKANDPRSWAKWEASGAIGNMRTAALAERAERITEQFGGDKEYDQHRRNGDLPADYNHALQFGLGIGPRTLILAEKFHLAQSKTLFEGIKENLKIDGHLAGACSSLDLCIKLYQDWQEVLSSAKYSFSVNGERKTLAEHINSVFRKKDGERLSESSIGLIALSDSSDGELYESALFLEKTFKDLNSLLECNKMLATMRTDLKENGVESMYVKEADAPQRKILEPLNTVLHSLGMPATELWEQAKKSPEEQSNWDTMWLHRKSGQVELAQEKINASKQLLEDSIFLMLNGVDTMVADYIITSLSEPEKTVTRPMPALQAAMKDDASLLTRLGLRA